MFRTLHNSMISIFKCAKMTWDTHFWAKWEFFFQSSIIAFKWTCMCNQLTHDFTLFHFTLIIIRNAPPNRIARTTCSSSEQLNNPWNFLGRKNYARNEILIFMHEIFMPRFFSCMKLFVRAYFTAASVLELTIRTVCHFNIIIVPVC